MVTNARDIEGGSEARTKRRLLGGERFVDRLAELVALGADLAREGLEYRAVFADQVLVTSSILEMFPAADEGLWLEGRPLTGTVRPLRLVKVRVLGK